LRLARPSHVQRDREASRCKHFFPFLSLFRGLLWLSYLHESLLLAPSRLNLQDRLTSSFISTCSSSTFPLSSRNPCVHLSSRLLIPLSCLQLNPYPRPVSFRLGKTLPILFHLPSSDNRHSTGQRDGQPLLDTAFQRPSSVDDPRPGNGERKLGRGEASAAGQESSDGSTGQGAKAGCEAAG
jgi:hypothetical protein